MSHHKDEKDHNLPEGYDEEYDRTDDTQEDPAPEEESPKKKGGFFSGDDKIYCPRCRHRLESRHACPYCGYNGYIPMSEKQTRRIRLLLFPLILIIAIILFFIIKK